MLATFGLGVSTVNSILSKNASFKSTGLDQSSGFSAVFNRITHLLLNNSPGLDVPWFWGLGGVASLTWHANLSKKFSTVSMWAFSMLFSVPGSTFTVTGAADVPGWADILRFTSGPPSSLAGRLIGVTTVSVGCN